MELHPAKPSLHLQAVISIFGNPGINFLQQFQIHITMQLTGFDKFLNKPFSIRTHLMLVLISMQSECGSALFRTQSLFLKINLINKQDMKL